MENDFKATSVVFGMPIRTGEPGSFRVSGPEA